MRTTWMTLAALVCFAAPARAEDAIPASDWPQFKRDASRSGDNPGAALQFPLQRITAIRLPAPIYASPAVVGGLVYVQDALGHVVCVDARKNQVVIEVKEITLRPHIDEHDYQTKIRAMQKFLSEGDKVKVTLRFRGREMSHLDIGRALLERIANDLKEFGKLESAPKVEGRNMGMMIGSLTTKKSKASEE